MRALWTGVLVFAGACGTSGTAAVPTTAATTAATTTTATTTAATTTTTTTTTTATATTTTTGTSSTSGASATSTSGTTGAACVPPVGTAIALGTPGSAYGLTLSTADAGLPQGVTVVFDGGAAYAGVSWPVSPTQDWSDAGAFGLTFENIDADGIRLGVELVDGTDAQLATGVSLAQGTQTFAFSFTDAAALGMQALPPYAGCIPTLYLPALPVGFGSAIGTLNLRIDGPPTLQGALRIGAPELWSAPQTFVGLVDALGQYTGRAWPGKAASVQDLQAQAAAEAPSVALDGGGPGLDAYGGTTLVAPRSATGYFRVEQISDGGFWLVDPLGNLFFSIGMDTIGVQSSTLITDRESMFLSVPDGGPFLHHVTGVVGPTTAGAAFDFVGADTAAKYAVSDPAQTNYDLALRRLWAWGFNTVGAFSTSDYAAGSGQTYSTRVPYTAFLRSTSSANLTIAGRGMPDPYAPSFSVSFTGFGGAISDPYLLGYFVDNELPWAPYSGALARFALSYAVLATDASDASSYAKQAFLAGLQTEYPTIAALNSAWGTSYASFAALSPPLTLPAQLSGLTAAAQADLEALSLAFARQYFTSVQAKVRAFDANHLYLGAKFSAYTVESVQACAESADVISFDDYGPTLADYSFLNVYAKPALIGEHSFGAADRGMFWGGIRPVATQAERAAGYQSYLSSVLANPQFVGSHWFEYWDEPVLGRYFDGENGNYGFVSVTDQPYPELVAAAQSANAAVYATLLGQ